MYILGISCFYHDSAAVLLKDGKLLCAIEEERLSRIKHDSDFPKQAINYCLEYANITPSDLSYIVFHEKPFRKFERIFKTTINSYPKSSLVFAKAMKIWLSKKLWVKSIIKEYFDISQDKILFSDHHLSHAASAFLLSPFEESAILTIDGVGEWATNTQGVGKNSDINLLRYIPFPHSLGLLYSAFTAFLGFQVNEGEYKVMGMAAYGNPVFTDKIFDQLVNLKNDGSFLLNLDYFSFHYSTKKSYTKKFEKLFGPSRKPDQNFFTSKFEYPSYFGQKPDNYQLLEKQNQYYADIAASIQKVTEEIILKQAKILFKLTGLKQLCLAGGVALNSVANARIQQEGPFERIFIQPAAGDSGAALGAALYAYNSILKNKRCFTLEHAFWGKEYSDTQIHNFLISQKIPFTSFKTDSELIKKVCAEIIDGKVIGWFQGRFEWGPRALGNRSILADPRNKKMKNIVNLKIKFREPFRPFAPVILEEELSNYFQTKNSQEYPLRFMLMVLNINPDKKDIIPAVNHEGTGRVQTIKREWNPLYYDLISEFKLKTGIPILLNTSFNLKGEPIVNSPQNAYNTFIRSGLDTLVLGKHLIQKSDLKNKEVKNEKNN